MNLFDTENQCFKNILPINGTVNYYGKILSTQQAIFYFNTLLNTIAWQHDKALIFGKLITTKRQVAWYGHSNFEYIYSGVKKYALPFTSHLLELKQMVEQITGETFNSCLLNLYNNGSEGMAWHSDAEKKMKKNGAIASLSLGAARNFMFKHKTSHQKVSLILENGSLLVMKDTTQSHWLHKLPTSTKVITPRINLTFRTIEN